MNTMAEWKTRSVTFGESGTVTFVEDTLQEPGYNEVLVRMMACGICKYDVATLNDLNESPRYSNRPGHEGVGVVEAVGPGVEDLKPGMKIASIMHGGAMSELFMASRTAVVPIPDHVEDYALWIAEPVACAVSSLRLLHIEPGEDVVLIGSGYMGILLLQGLPKEYLPNLVVIDVDDNRLELAKRYGAKTVVNAARKDPVKKALEITGRKVDLVIEAVGKPGTIAQATDMLRDGGRLCIFGLHYGEEPVPTGYWHMHGIEVLNTSPFMSRDFNRDLKDAARLIDGGIFDQSELITHRYSYDEVSRAMRETTDHPPDMIKSVLVRY
jgi:threonine dehydrogenase-like Zn-dependent dehydrogenase